MKKAILISIRPEWVAKILNGEKTIEIRKTVPKCGFPIDVYVYCSKGERNLSMDTHHCCIGFDLRGDTLLNGKVVAKFTLKNADKVAPFFHWCEKLKEKSCLTWADVLYYMDPSPYSSKRRGIVYAWNISDLEVFDEPKELSDFFSLPETYHHDHDSMVDHYERKEARRLKRAPRSWQYVEEEK